MHSHISKIGNEMVHRKILYWGSIWNLFNNTICIVEIEKIQASTVELAYHN
jgi:hypothetical protein